MRNIFNNISRPGKMFKNGTKKSNIYRIFFSLAAIILLSTSKKEEEKQRKEEEKCL